MSATSGEVNVMRVCVAAAIMALALGGGAASAQSIPAPGADRGYAEAVLQSAFGNVTSQSYGAEGGFTVRPNLQVFFEGGMVRNIATDEISAAAQTIAGFLSQTQSNVGFTVRQPVGFFAGGVKLLFPTSSSLRPYVLGGGGVANVKQDVTFTIAGNDVTSVLPTQYGTTLGTDLSGSFTKPMIEFGAGLMWPAWQQLVIDVQFRYGHIFADDAGINVSRAGVGIGVRF
jgi:opacity protein-like surface antigen